MKVSLNLVPEVMAEENSEAIHTKAFSASNAKVV